MELREVEFYIQVFEDMARELHRPREITENELLPVYETMTRLFDD